MKMKILLSLAATSAALITQSVLGGTIPIIVFSERSDTTLTAVYYNGTGGSTPLTLLDNSPDSWSFDTASARLVATNGASWTEPSSEPGEVNQVLMQNEFTFIVLSDSPSFGVGGLPNHGITSYPIAVSQLGSFPSVYGQFNDPVPDTGTTFGLLALALSALFGATRFRARQLA